MKVFKFSSESPQLTGFHKSLPIFFYVSRVVNGSLARQNFSIFSANLCMYNGLPPLRNLCTKKPILMDRTLTA